MPRYTYLCWCAVRIVWVSESAHSFFLSLFDSFYTVYVYNTICVWRNNSVSVLHVYLLACLAAFLSHVSWAVVFLSFVFRQPASDSVFLTDSQLAFVQCVRIYTSFYATAYHFNESYTFFLPKTNAYTERKTSTHSVTHTPHTHIYAKIKIIIIININMVTR